MHNAYTSSALAFGQFRARSKSLFRKPIIIRREKRRKKEEERMPSTKSDKNSEDVKDERFLVESNKITQILGRNCVVKAVNKQTECSVYNEQKWRDQFKSI